MMDRAPSVRKLQLLVPHLDHDAAIVEPPKMSIWTSSIMTTIYTIVAVALVFRNHRILYVIPLYFAFETLQVILKWRKFVVEDPQVLTARSHLANHHMKQVKKALNKSKVGGYLRRRKVAIVAGMSGTLFVHVHDFFERQSDLIRRRTSDDHRRSMAVYSTNVGEQQ